LSVARVAVLKTWSTFACTVLSARSPDSLSLRGPNVRTTEGGHHYGAAWLLGVIWGLPLIYAISAAIHPSAFSTTFDLFAPLTWNNFARAWDAAPFARYFLNTVMLVLGIMAGQFVVCTLAAFALSRWKLLGGEIVFALILVQLMVTPDILIVANYRTLHALGLIDSLTGIGLPYIASAFGIFSAPANVQVDPKGARRRCANGGGEHSANLVAGLFAASAACLHSLWPCFGQLSLEQFSLAADCDELCRDTAANGRIAGLRFGRSRRRLVGNLCGSADDFGTSNYRIPDLPSRLHPSFSASRHPVGAHARECCPAECERLISNESQSGAVAVAPVRATTVEADDYNNACSRSACLPAAST
jgi:hypothetical protein